MRASAAECARRLRTRWTGRIHSLPILALHVHSACNCRCVMCDIWRANRGRHELASEAIATHVGAIRRLHVSRVMLTGGEPLLHSNLWRLCDALAAEGVRVTLVTTGLLLARHADEVARAVDTVVVSLDGPPDVHDAIRHVRGGVASIAAGLHAIGSTSRPPRLTARSVLQRDNYRHLAATIATAREMGFEEISFLAADVVSTAFNRPEPWNPARRAEVAVPAEELTGLATAIAEAARLLPTAFSNGFVAGGVASLERIHAYYAALAGTRAFPSVRCNAPWVSAVVELDGSVRPCFFHPPYEASGGDLAATLNAPAAVQFRRGLNPADDPVCRRCVCSLNLPWTAVP